MTKFGQEILVLSKLKVLGTFADKEINVTLNIEFVLHRVEIIVGKGDTLLPVISSFPHCFPKGLMPQSMDLFSNISGTV